MRSLGSVGLLLSVASFALPLHAQKLAVVADHIIARKAGGADALHNTRSLCRLHDNRFREDPTGQRRAGG